MGQAFRRIKDLVSRVVQTAVSKERQENRMSQEDYSEGPEHQAYRSVRDTHNVAYAELDEGLHDELVALGDYAAQAVADALAADIRLVLDNPGFTGLEKHEFEYNGIWTCDHHVSVDGFGIVMGRTWIDAVRLMAGKIRAKQLS